MLTPDLAIGRSQAADLAICQEQQRGYSGWRQPLDGAHAAFERALAIFERFLPPDHPNIALVRGNLAGLGRP